VPTTLSGGNVVLAATLREPWPASTEAPTTASHSPGFPGNGTSGLPDAGVSKLIADPGNANRFYAGVPANFGGGAAAGVYRSDDGV